ncbi:hypothetical protein ABFS83_09G070500 [Erythranthe nasuta]
MAESFPMIGGNGTYSYTKNSQYQKEASDIAKEMIKEAVIEKLDPKTILSGTSTAFHIVDFGCSVGPNTFFTVQNLIEAVETKFSSIIFQGLENPPTTTSKTLELEFQVFFNDHTRNDFNTLFTSLPPDRRYHAAAAPGSFHGRLFPRASIQLAHSSYALQWLSKVPEGLTDRKSTAWNGAMVHYTDSSEQVLNAYAGQYEKDMGVFLSARAEEIVSGGLVVLILPGIPDGVRHSEIPANVFYTFLGSSLLDLVHEGIVDKAEVDAFNLPIYAPSNSELRKLIEKNGSFSIERLEVTIPNSQAKIDSSHVHSLIMHFRAALGGIFSKHFGNDVVEKMFDKTLAKSEEISKTLNTIYPLLTHFFVVLKRN